MVAERLGDAPAVAVAALPPADVDAKAGKEMADVRDKALNVCSDVSSGSDMIIAGLDKILAASKEKSQSGLNLTDVEIEAALANSSLKHAEGGDFNNALGAADAFRDWLVSSGNGGNFQKVRP